jgi:hypothetical protein
MPKPKTLVLPPLMFDSSGSAQVRFAGPLAIVDVHWAKFGAKIAQAKLACPGTAEDDDFLVNGGKHAVMCKACAAGTPRKQRGVAIGWDVTSGRWCLFMAAPAVFAEAFEKSVPHGVTPARMTSGDGLNVVVQRVGMSTVVEVVPESGGTRPQGDAGVPDMALVLAGLRKKSLWTKYSTPDEIPSMDGPESPDGPSVLWAQNFPKYKDLEDCPKASPAASPKPSGRPRDEWMDGSSLIARNRWEMI